MPVWHEYFWQLILLFSLFLLLFMGSTALFSTIHESHCTISANFYLYLQYFQQKVFSFSKISGWISFQTFFPTTMGSVRWWLYFARDLGDWLDVLHAKSIIRRYYFHSSLKSWYLLLVSRSLLVTLGTNVEHIAYKQKDRSHRPWHGLGKKVDHIEYGFFGLVLYWLQGLICISLLNEKKNEAWLKFIDCSLNHNGFLFVFVVEQKKLQLHHHLSHWSVTLTVVQKVCTFFLVETHVHRLFPKVLNAIDRKSVV